MRTTIAVLVALVLGVALASPREFFQRHVAIQNDPIVQGTLFVDVTYDDQNTQPSGTSNYRDRRFGRMRLDYYDSINEATRQIIFSEAYDFGRKFRWTFCPPNSCEALSYKSPMPLFYRDPAFVTADGWSANPVDSRDFLGVSCSGYSRNFASGDSTTQEQAPSLNAVDKIWIDTNTDRPCAARFRSGKEFVFYYTDQGRQSFSAAAIDDTSITNDQGTTVTPVPPSGLPGPFNCPKPSCKIPLDLTFSLDESSSIITSDFALLKDFVISVISSLTIGKEDVQVGVNLFAYGVRVLMPLQRNATQAINFVTTLNRAGGATCIGCGIQRAHDSLGRTAACTSALDTPAAGVKKDANSRADAIKAIIVITDGIANVNEGATFDEIITNTRCDNITVYSIGVGEAATNATALARFTSPPASQNSFAVSNYAGLSGILTQLLQVTCQEIVVSTCGRNCAGLCACNQQCICPPSCESTDKCQQGTCNPASPSLGCLFENLQTVCEDAAAVDNCLIGTCDPAIGCVNNTKSCDDGDPCTYDYCDNTVAGGCLNIRRDDPLILTIPNVPANQICADNDVCTTDTCTVSGDTFQCSNTPVAGGCASCQGVTGAPVNCSSQNFNPDWDKVSPCNPYVCDLTYDVQTLGKYDLVNNANNPPGPCKAQPLNFEDTNPCTINECIAVNGKPALNRTYVDCSSLVQNSCQVGICNENSGKAQGLESCEVSPKNCDDGNFCTDDTCDTSNPSGCLDVPLRPLLNCTAQAIANGTYDQCQVYDCDFQVGCVSTLFDCTPLPNIAAQCYEILCDATIDPKDERFFPYVDAVRVTTSTFPCAYTPVEASFDDCNNCPPRTAECFSQNLNSGAVIGIITGGVIAAIVVAIIVALACGIGGGVGGYVYYQKRNGNPMANAQKSDIYQGSGNSGSSGLYKG